MKKIQILFSGLMLLFLLTSCSKYRDTNIGEVTAIRKGATIRTEGGGIDSSVYFAGAHRVAGVTISVEEFKTSYVPQWVSIPGLGVTMPKLKNQKVFFDIGLYMNVNPHKWPNTFSNFKGWNMKIKNLFSSVAIKELGKLAMRGSGKSTDVSDFDSREAVADSILNKFIDEYKIQYPQFVNNFFFHKVVLGNIDYPTEIMDNFVSNATEEYLTEKARVEEKVNKVREEYETVNTIIDNEAFASEATNLDPNALEFMWQSLYDKFTQSEDVNVIHIIETDSRGIPLDFKSRK